MALGFRALALGRWYVNSGERSETPLALLNEAAGHFTALGMDPWLLYARIHAIRALAALERFDEVNRQLEGIRAELQRFPVLESFVFEALAQMQSRGR